MKTIKETLLLMVEAHNTMAKAVRGCKETITQGELFELWQPLGNNETRHASLVTKILDKYNVSYSYNIETNLITLK